MKSIVKLPPNLATAIGIGITAAAVIAVINSFDWVGRDVVRNGFNF